MLDHSAVEHSRRNIPPTAFLLEVIKTLEDDAFSVGETVSNIWQIVTRIRGTHRQFSLLSIR
jgi:hypothetical protein